MNICKIALITWIGHSTKEAASFSLYAWRHLVNLAKQDWTASTKSFKNSRAMTVSIRGYIGLYEVAYDFYGLKLGALIKKRHDFANCKLL